MQINQAEYADKLDSQNFIELFLFFRQAFPPSPQALSRACPKGTFYL